MPAVLAAPVAASGTWRTEYGRHPSDRKKFSSRVDKGKVAVTHWRVVEPLRGAALVRFDLETGRTHQIRVHCADHHVPLLGDPVYGRARLGPRRGPGGPEITRQALHAARLEFTHPRTGRRVTCTAPLPDDIARLLARLRAEAAGDVPPGSEG